VDDKTGSADQEGEGTVIASSESASANGKAEAAVFVTN
jgi:hypothetical protein